MTAALELISVSKFYEPSQGPAVYEISVRVESGQTLALVGPSGCGKTTTLRLVAGFETPDRGEILLKGTRVAGPGRFVPPERRGVGMVFQDHFLFPHLTVGGNIAFGLNARPRAETEATVDHLLRLMDMERMRDRYPHELSGGERQRVALARALAPQPVLVLFDEPFTGLDAELRGQMRDEVRAILRQTSSTALFVTHDQTEALFMGDVVAVLQGGRIEQMASPESVYHRPATRFVAEFLGHSMFLPARVTASGLETEIGALAQRVDLPLGTEIDVACRADDIRVAADREGQCLILNRFFQGGTNMYRVRLPLGRLVHSLQPHTINLAPGTRVRAWLEPSHSLPCFRGPVAIPSATTPSG
ncbi:MAG: ABC transporter ATP-binding protein [Anaerolineales bacterium]